MLHDINDRIVLEKIETGALCLLITVLVRK